MCVRTAEGAVYAPLRSYTISELLFRSPSCIWGVVLVGLHGGAGTCQAITTFMFARGEKAGRKKKSVATRGCSRHAMVVSVRAATTADAAALATLEAACESPASRAGAAVLGQRIGSRWPADTLIAEADGVAVGALLSLRFSALGDLH